MGEWPALLSYPRSVLTLIILSDPWISTVLKIGGQGTSGLAVLVSRERPEDSRLSARLTGSDKLNILCPLFKLASITSSQCWPAKDHCEFKQASITIFYKGTCKQDRNDG